MRRCYEKFLVILITCFIGLWLSNAAATKQVNNEKLLSLEFQKLLKTDWYSIDHIDNLIQTICEQVSGAACLYPVTTIDTLKAAKEVISKKAIQYNMIFLPLMVDFATNAFDQNKTNHFVGLVVHSNNTGSVVRLQYVDPEGKKMDQKLCEQLQEFWPHAAIEEVYNEETCPQELGDGCNCGPLLIHVFTQIANQQPLTFKIVSSQQIQQLRQNHVMQLMQFESQALNLYNQNQAVSSRLICQQKINNPDLFQTAKEMLSSGKVLTLPFLPTKQSQVQSCEIVQNKLFIPKVTKAEVQLMTESVLKQLKHPQAFDCQIHLKGATIGQHILKYHVNYSGKKSRLGDAYYSTDQYKSLFVSKTSTGMDVLTMIQQSIINRPIQDFNVCCCIHDGMLDLVIQLRVKDLQYYTRNERKQSGYIVICVRKVWLGDHWSCNLTPSTIYPSDKMKTRIRIIGFNGWVVNKYHFL